MKFLFLFILILSTFISCSEGLKDPKEEEVVLDPLDPKNQLVNFKNADIEKDVIFLFTAAQIQGPPAPTGNALRSKLVQLKRQDGDLCFFEADKGKLASESIKTKTPLFKLPIMTALSTEEFTTVNFKGLNDVFIANSYYTSDYPEDNLAEINLKIEESYVSEVKNVAEFMFINQYVKARDLETGKFAQFQMKYTLSKYNPNKNFEPKDSTLQEKIGFFENWPVIDLNTEEEHTYIFKFDHKKPIPFHLSSNIPSEWQQAVKDGVLYWNRVFGKDIVKVDTLPNGVGVHDPGYNIVQWIKWDTAGFAYADMQADPMTGETLQAHVYMTSVFAIGGLEDAKEFLNSAEAKKVQRTKKLALGLKGFSPLRTCQHDHRALKDLASVIHHIESLKRSKLDSEKLFQKYAADYIREVVAHEIGHTLGLRHNFAGSLHTETSPEEFNKIFADYFSNDVLPKSPLGSTVMDYSPSKVAALMGAHIRLSTLPLAYDKQAIEWGYSDKSIEDMDASIPFCTDSHAYEGKFLDCKIWDRFSNPISNAALEWNESGRELIFSMLNRYQDLLDEELSEEEKEIILNEISFSPAEKAANVVTKLKSLIEMFDPKAKFKSVEDTYQKEDIKDQAHYKKLLASYQKDLLKANGEISTLLFASFAIDPASLKTPYLASLESHFEALFSKLYVGKISEDEETKIRQTFTKFFQRFDLELLIEFTQALKEKTFFQYEEFFKAKLTSVVEPILFTKSQIIVTETPNYVLYDAHFNYNNGKFELREEMAKTFMTNFFPAKPIYFKNLELVRSDYLARHKKEVESSLSGVELKDLTNDELYEWLVGEKKIFKVLDASLL